MAKRHQAGWRSHPRYSKAADLRTAEKERAHRRRQLVNYTKEGKPRDKSLREYGEDAREHDVGDRVARAYPPPCAS